MNLLYTIDATVDEPIMLLDRHIGDDTEEGEGIKGDLFAKELLYLDSLGKKKIKVWINSPGGVVTDGMNIYNAILKSKAKVDTYCIGIAASIAAVIFQAGRNRIMADYSLLMYHNPSGGDDEEALRKIKESLVIMIAGRSGKGDKEISKMMDKTSWILAGEAEDMGMCDDIETSSNFNKARVSISEGQSIKMAWSSAKNIVNKSVDNLTIKPNKMLKITNKLGLNESANEDSILTAINSIVNENADFKKKAEELKKKMEDSDEAMKKMSNDYNDLLNKIKADEEAKKESDKVENKTKAKNMIEGFVKSGKIKNEATIIASWEEKAEADPEGIKNLLESLPVNTAKAPVYADGNKEFKPGSVIGNAMKNLRETHKIS